MTQNNYQCGCDHPQLTMVPVQGFGLAMDLSGLKPAPAPVPVGRERVDHDMHIYIDGNRSESGDGLSPETAVNSYGDAVLALSRYDGCNQYSVYFHFADLTDPEARYPDMTIQRGHYSTFCGVNISGVSHETTNLGCCGGGVGVECTLNHISASLISSVGGLIRLRGAIAITPRHSDKGCLVAHCGGSLYLENNLEISIHPGSCLAVVYALCGGTVYHYGSVTFHTLGTVQASSGFVLAAATSSVRFTRFADFSQCTSVVGPKYSIMELSSLKTSGVDLPGSMAGAAYSGAVYS